MYTSNVKTTHTKIVNGQSVTTVITKQSSSNGSSTTTSETFRSSNKLTNNPDLSLRNSLSSTTTVEKPKSLFGIFRKKVPSTSDENNESLAVKNVKHFETDCLLAHNKYRKMHGAEDLKLNKAMCKYALEWAKQLAANDQMQHRPDKKFGENIYWASGGNITGTSAVEAWYNEIKDYNFHGNGQFSPSTGHFTQVVWQQSRELGVGIAQSKSGGIFIVTNYDPPGNYIGEFNKNVLPLGSKKTRSTEVKAETTSHTASKLNNSKTFDVDCLLAHNNYRQKHGVPPLVLDKDISKYSQEWANKLAAEDRMYHRPNGKYGENLFMASGMEVAGGYPVEKWYSEIKSYNFQNGGFSSNTGHFTQVVWKNSKGLGVGTAKSKNGSVYVVANYDIPGNVLGAFKDNVLPPKK